MISYDDALKFILAAIEPTEPEICALKDALGRVTSDDIVAPISMPRFDNSAMDGFATRAEWTINAPVSLPILATVYAGDKEDVPVNEAPHAIRIMTGAALPKGYDTVVPIELVEITDNAVTLKSALKVGANIRKIGEDFREGDVLLRTHEAITPAKIMVLAAAGLSHPPVQSLPEIYGFNTGDELTSLTAPQLTGSQIYNSSGPFLAASAANIGLKATIKAIGDDPEALMDALSQVPPHSLIVTTGAVSMGDKDFIPDVVRTLGAEVKFHRVNIRPAKPILFAIMPNGSLFFGLPGNPISTAVGWRFFVKPALRALMGQGLETPIMAQLSHTFTKRIQMTQFLKARLHISESGQVIADISDGQESFKISPYAKTNAFVRLGEDVTEVKAGELVPCYPFEGAWS